MKTLGSLLLLAGGFAAGSFAMGGWEGWAPRVARESREPLALTQTTDAHARSATARPQHEQLPAQRVVYVTEPGPERVVYVEVPRREEPSPGSLRAHASLADPPTTASERPRSEFDFDDNRELGSARWQDEAAEDLRAGRSAIRPPEPLRASSDEDRRVEIPQGTIIESELDATLSSRTARPGDRVRARVSRDVLQAGEVVLPEGSVLLGVVQEARSAGRVKGNGHLSLAFTEVVLPDGRASSFSGIWEKTAEGKHKRDAAIIGGSAAGGALLGQIIGGDSESTAAGAVLGGAIGSGVVLSNKGRELDLEPGTRLVFETRSASVLPLS